ncbi:50S ribosomal protein L21 [Patescibacteria group bacterium]|nr:50S ribosomal protein L21 [Patescibacteria group bacterium]MBU3923219.1 50S ribosomal protein L21 [Patescibacteria group bacterium]
MLAIIKTGGKQYLVKKGDKIKVEKIEKKKGEEIEFTDILLLKDKEIEIGKPLVKAIVIGKILEQEKADKIIIYKYKAKKRYSQKKGHRQPYTEVEIIDIKKTTQKVAEKKEEK